MEILKIGMVYRTDEICGEENRTVNKALDGRI